MPRSNWSDADKLVLGILAGILVFGLGFFVWLGPQEQARPSQPTQTSKGQQDWANPSSEAEWWKHHDGNAETYDAICHDPGSKEYADLCQQWRSANAAAQSMQIAQWQLWASWFGVAGLLATISLTFAATRAAQKSTKIAEDSLLNADRPQFIVMELQIGSLGAELFELGVPFLYRFQNYGKGPGWITGVNVWGMTAEPHELPVHVTPMAIGQSNWPVAPSNWWGTQALTNEQALAIPTTDRQAIVAGTKFFYLVGILHYNGGGAARYEYQFVYQFMPKANRFIPIAHPFCKYT
jgi:hypothetical protein